MTHESDRVVPRNLTGENPPARDAFGGSTALERWWMMPDELTERYGTSCRHCGNHMCDCTESVRDRLRAATEVHRLLAGRYGVSESTISAIKRRKKWQWVA